ncbi:MAG: alpha/beta fold hydrolase [Deltaproteobacteria bacterium]|uniref:Alpha/beta fold hydrolase n=1 Tax=Candidatus Zymogenus saltonus TaxID=2844893 RepID=A0A9D8KCN4_9DELT|nr:alpha/beta fold hydrolase [Candidatus Zymogenus saltonus]
MKKLLGVILILILALAVALGVNYAVQELKAPVPAVDLVDYGSFTNVDGINLHVRVEGLENSNKTPIILIHGFTASLYTWRFNIEDLGKKFPVYALDLPGFGYSDKPKDFQYDLDGYADFIVKFMDAMKIKKAILVGNSMGGGIAMKTALNHPDRVAKLVLIDSVGYAEVKRRFLVFALMGYPVVGEVLMSLNHRSVLEHSLKGGPYYDNSFVTDDVVDSYYNVYKTEYARKVPLIVMRNLLKNYPFKEGEIKNIAAPTLVIWGSNDRLISVDVVENFTRDIKGSSAVVFPETGHMPQEEKADLVNGLITNFANE